VVGIAVDELPAFLATSSGQRLPHAVADAEKAAALIGAHFAIPGSAGLLLVQPPPPALALPNDELAGWTDAAVSEARDEQISGGALTPYVLARLAELSGGRTLRTNIGLIVNNARTAAAIAVARARRKTG
jgi:pseudouridine-5'-phosphate glycosidase